MLMAGVPLSKLDKCRDWLDENAFSLTMASTLHQLLLFILKNEICRLKSEIAGKCVSILFDSTTHVCEALVIMFI